MKFSFKKVKKSKQLNNNVLLVLVIAIFGLGYMYYYSCEKKKVNEKMAPVDLTLGQSQNPSVQQVESSSTESTKYASVNEAVSTNIPSHVKLDARELLPKDGNTEFSKLNPNVNVGGQNHLVPSPQNFINLGEPKRNSNLQLRSEPPNPQMSVCPWNNTTIQPNTMRKPLEIGSQH